MSDWHWSAQQRLAWIESCMALGITTFDHADVYGDHSVEALFGDAMALQPSLREHMQLVTKCGIKPLSSRRPAHTVKSYDTSRGHLIRSVEGSLRALRTDRLDVLLIHRPDALLDAEEVAGAFDTLRRDGKVLHFGVSNFTPRQFELLHASTALCTNQIELHPLHRTPLHDGTLDQAQSLKIRPMTWSPLGGGRLFDPAEPRSAALAEVLRRLAASHDATPTSIAFAWLLRHPSRPIPVAGTRRIDALREAVQALDVELDRESWYEILKAASGHDVP